MKIIINIIRSFMLSIFIIYIFNRMAESINISIPINSLTVLIVGTLEIPGLILLIILKLLI